LIQNAFTLSYNRNSITPPSQKLWNKWLGFNSRHKCWESGMALGHPVYHPKLINHFQWHEKESGEALFSARTVLYAQQYLSFYFTFTVHK
jgi:hypothetical protein